MSIVENTELTSREFVLLENERDEARLQREHAIHLKELEIMLERTKAEAEVSLRTLEAKWNSWLKIPVLIVKLPLYVLLGVGYIVLAMRKQRPTESFWNFIK